MGDQAERVVLEADDQVTPITSKANAALENFERKATSSGEKIVRINDQTRTSVQRLIASLEKQTETYGKSGVEKLIAQRDQLLQRYQREPAAIDAITRSYQKMIDVEIKAAQVAAEAERKRAEAQAAAQRAAAGPGCSIPVNNVPPSFNIHLMHYRNPKSAMLTDGALPVRAALAVMVGSGTKGKRSTFEINGDGVIVIPESFFGSVPSQVELSVSFGLQRRNVDMSCWTFSAILPDTEARPMICSKGEGRLDCRVVIPDASAWLHRSVAFQMTPIVPDWFPHGPGLSAHSLNKTISTLRSASVVQPPIRVIRSDAAPVSALTVELVAGR